MNLPTGAWWTHLKTPERYSSQVFWARAADGKYVCGPSMNWYHSKLNRLENSVGLFTLFFFLSLSQSFTLEFHFEPNGYFNNAVLTKVYKMKSEPEASDPFSFEGPEIIDCEGWETEHTACVLNCGLGVNLLNQWEGFCVVCKTFLFTLSIFTSHISASSWHLFQLLPLRVLTFCCLSLGSTPPLSSCQIDWHKGKDVTVKTIKKKQKHKGRGTVRTVTKQVPNDSFFNFFNPVKGEDTHNAHTFNKHTQKIVHFSEGWNVTFKASVFFSHESNHWDSKLNSASCVVTALERAQIYRKLCRVQPHANTPAGQSACLC